MLVWSRFMLGKGGDHRKGNICRSNRDLTQSTINISPVWVRPCGLLELATEKAGKHFVQTVWKSNSTSSTEVTSICAKQTQQKQEQVTNVHMWFGINISALGYLCWVLTHMGWWGVVMKLRKRSQRKVLFPSYYIFAIFPSGSRKHDKAIFANSTMTFVFLKKKCYCYFYDPVFAHWHVWTKFLKISQNNFKEIYFHKNILFWCRPGYKLLEVVLYLYYNDFGK